MRNSISKYPSLPSTFCHPGEATTSIGHPDGILLLRSRMTVWNTVCETCSVESLRNAESWADSAVDSVLKTYYTTVV